MQGYCLKLNWSCWSALWKADSRKCCPGTSDLGESTECVITLLSVFGERTLIFSDGLQLTAPSRVFCEKCLFILIKCMHSFTSPWEMHKANNYNLKLIFPWTKASGKDWALFWRLNKSHKVSKQIKGVLHKKNDFTHHHVLPNLYDFLTSVEHKRWYLNNASVFAHTVKVDEVQPNKYPLTLIVWTNIAETVIQISYFILHKFGSTWVWVNDRTFLTIHLS